MNPITVLDSWYATHPAIRRLWAISEAQGIRVIVTLEPTHDGDDIYPAWLAKSRAWAHDLQSRIDAPVQLEVVDDLTAGPEGVLVAALSWRDASSDAE